MTPLEEAVLEAIRAEPGLAPKEYALRLPWTYQTAVRAARRLVARGLVRRTGATNSARYWPA